MTAKISANSNPAWVERMLDFYGSGVAHAFICHFNTSDYTSPQATITPAKYLSQLLANREIVAIYSRDRGIEFPTETMKKAAMDILFPEDKEASQTSNPALDALRAVGGAPSSDERQLPKAPDQALPLLDKLLRATNKDGKMSAVIIEQAELILPDADLATMPPDDRTALATVARWGRDQDIVQSGNPVYLMAGNLASLHRELRAASNRYEAIEIPLPDTEARLAYIKRYLNDRPVTLDAGLTVEMAANATAGLSLLHVEDILLRGEARGKVTTDLIWDRKKDIIRAEFGDVLEIIEPRFTFASIGGLEHIKNFFLRSVIRPIAEGRKSRVPMGILMTGAAGTGKSIMAEAVASEAGINAVKLRIGGQIASKWQGEGERNLEKALRAISGLAPTIVFIDEIDQAVQRGEGNSTQQDQRIFQRLLEFMSETSHRGEIVFLAATNRPDLMDAALRRPGRFDKKIPFLIPDDDERRAIFEVMSFRYLGEKITPNATVITVTNGWTGAEIEAVAVKAVELVEDEGLEPAIALVEATERLSPSTADIEFMTMLAIQEVNDRDLLPPKYQEKLNNRAKLDEEVKKAREASEQGFTRTRREL